MKTSATSSQAASPGQRLKRILLSISCQAERDIAQLVSSRRESHIHALRVRMKKLRALLPLIESSTGTASMKAILSEVHALRQAFAPNRDRQVMASLLARFSSAGAAPCPSARLKSVRLPGTQKLRLLQAAARALTLRLQSLRLRPITPGAVAASFSKNYAEVRRRHDRCRRRPAPKRMHHWRKAVKDHYFLSLLLLRDRRHCKSARQLGSLLGDLHDLELLKEQLGEGLPEDLRQDIKRRAKKLKARAFRNARRLLDRAPAKLAKEVLKAHRVQSGTRALPAGRGRHGCPSWIHGVDNTVVPDTAVPLITPRIRSDASRPRNRDRGNGKSGWK